jgi:hypothetical protein
MIDLHAAISGEKKRKEALSQLSEKFPSVEYGH